MYYNLKKYFLEIHILSERYSRVNIITHEILWVYVGSDQEKKWVFLYFVPSILDDFSTFNQTICQSMKNLQKSQKFDKKSLFHV